MNSIDRSASLQLADTSAVSKAFMMSLRYLSDIEIDQLAACLVEQSEHQERVAARAGDFPHGDEESRTGARLLAEHFAARYRRLALMAKHRYIVGTDPDEQPERYAVFCMKCESPPDDPFGQCSTCQSSDYVVVVDADRAGLPPVADRPTEEDMKAYWEARRSGAIDPATPLRDLL